VNKEQAGISFYIITFPLHMRLQEVQQIMAYELAKDGLTEERRKQELLLLT
jgi:hypothetical protein